MMRRHRSTDATTKQRPTRRRARALLVLLALLAAALLAPVSSASAATIFDSSAPSGDAVTDGTPIELGVKFRTTQNGFITGLRFYKQSNNTGTHVGHLWSASGQQLAEATFTGETASGWQTVQLSNPVSVTAGTTYVASYWSASGYFAFTGRGLESAVANGPVTALADGTDGGNGVFRYGASGFPTGSWNASNYWADVVFEDSVAADTTPPTVTATSPADGATAVAAGIAPQVTFSEAIAAATVTSANFALRGPGGTAVAASLAYDAGTRTVTLTPSAALATSTSYTLTVGTGVTDTSDNHLASARIVTFTTAAPAPGTNCPCNIFGTTAPTGTAVSDGQAIEVGVKFRASENGFITGLRFYKQSNNSGTHIGHLWTADGQQLASATFVGESGSGWQEVDFDNPVAITAGTTYVASYWSSAGWFAYSPATFTSAVTTGPLSALADGTDGGNGVYRYGASGLPTSTFNATNYWVDVSFQRTVAADTTPPTVQSTSPAANAQGVAIGTTVQAQFNESINASTVTSANVRLTAPGGATVSADVAYSAATRSAILTPAVPLATETTYTATVKGGATGIADTHGNRMAADVTWTFTTAAPAPPPPNEGPGGPILVLATPADPYGKYYAEILRNEGLNEFTVSQASLNASLLSGYKTLILASQTLNATQISALTAWVQGGGNLIAMRPDKALAPLLGLTDAGTTLANTYLKVNTTTAPGAGIVDSTMQFHGTADRYALASGTTSIADLYSTASAATTNPAVSLRSVGSAGGQAAAFSYDLARSIVWTRQGNPAWAGQKRDGTPGPIRPDDAFYPNWIDVSKMRIPQADEQQRLLANLVTQMTMDQAPLPRFWYLPDGKKAAVVLTGDDHENNGTVGQFERYKDASPTGCSVVDWECVRSTSYMYPSTPMTDAQAAAYQAQGFELALHLNTLCSDYTEASLQQQLAAQLANFAAEFPSVAAPSTNRTHCVTWSDYAGTPKVSLANGIRLDTTFYQLGPQGWFTGPGSMTGSHMPMRFADTDGTMVDVYQATTQLPDELNEIGLSLPAFFRDYMDDALGSNGYYGVFTVNAHTDYPDSADADNIVAEAQENGVPVVSAKQMLQWLDARNASSFSGIAYSGNQLTFTVVAGSGAHGLRGMLPVNGPNGRLSLLKRDGVTVSRTIRTIKGIEYALFPASAGNYTATYATDTTAPDITAVTATADNDGRATVTWQTDEDSTSRVDFGTAPTVLTRNVTQSALVSDHSVELTSLTPGQTYYARVTSVDAAGNTATAPPAGSPVSFTPPAQRIVDTRIDDFDAGSDSNTVAAPSSDTTDGEVQLAPTERQDFEGTSLPSSWNATPWVSGGISSVSGGELHLDGASAKTDDMFSAPRTLEFSATLANAPDQAIGFSDDLTNYPLAVFTTGDSSNPTGLYAWTGENDEQRTQITGVQLGVPHRYRIEWTGAGIAYYVDGVLKASHTLDIVRDMRPIASDGKVGGARLDVQWLRMGDYLTSGTFTSRVLDGQISNRDWTVLATTSTIPSGTGMTYQTRTGNSANPDGTWTSWQNVAANGTIPNANGRYIQYRANLTSTSGTSTPTLGRVEATYAGGIPVNRAPVAGSVSITPSSPTTDQTLTATPSGFSDPDGDAITYRYQWLRNGTPIAGATSNTLDLSVAGNGNRNDVVRVEASAVDPYGLTSPTVASQQTVANSSPTVTAGGSASVVYSDQLTPITVSTSDPDGDAITSITASGLPSGITLANNGNGTATISGRPTASAGTYNATITASDGSRTGTATQQIVVTKETATVGYTGDMIDTTSSALSNNGTVAASAIVTQQADGLTGDLTRADVDFELYSGTTVDSSPDRTCSDSANSSGVASCDIGSVSTGDWTMVARIDTGNGYFQSAYSDPVLVTMYRRGTTRTFTSTNGAIVDPSFNNIPVAIAPAPNNQGQFTFSVRYATGSNTTPLSTATSTYQFRGVDGNRYVLTTTSWTGGGMYFNSSGGGAGWAATGTVQAFDAGNQVVGGLGGNSMRYRVDVIDGSPDRYAISIYTASGTLYHRAGTKSAPVTLASGAITSTS